MWLSVLLLQAIRLLPAFEMIDSDFDKSLWNYDSGATCTHIQVQLVSLEPLLNSISRNGALDIPGHTFRTVLKSDLPI